MHKLKLVLAALLSGVFSSTMVQAQSGQKVDAGISTHNYKHPNKAAQAKSEQSQIRVANLSTVERYLKNPRNGYVNTTPKYAVRPATLVVVKRYEIEKIDINPLISPRNYKTPSQFLSTKPLEIADYTTPGDSIYPYKD